MLSPDRRPVPFNPNTQPGTGPSSAIPDRIPTIPARPGEQQPASPRRGGTPEISGRPRAVPDRSVRPPAAAAEQPSSPSKPSPSKDQGLTPESPTVAPLPKPADELPKAKVFHELFPLSYYTEKYPDLEERVAAVNAGQPDPGPKGATTAPAEVAPVRRASGGEPPREKSADTGSSPDLGALHERVVAGRKDPFLITPDRTGKAQKDFDNAQRVSDDTHSGEEKVGLEDRPSETLAESSTIPAEEGKAAYDAWTDFLRGSAEGGETLGKIDNYIYGTEPTLEGGASERAVATFNEWLDSVPPDRRRGMEALREEIRQDAAHQDAADESRIAHFSVPELLQGTLPPDQAARMATPYAVGIRQEASDTIGEAVDLINEEGGIADGIGISINPVNLGNRFLVTDSTDPSAADSVVKGYYGGRLGRFVVAVPIEGASPAQAANPAQYAGERDNLPSDFTLEEAGDRVNPKYIAGFIDGDDTYHKNTEFMRSNTFVPETQEEPESDWLD